MISPVHFMKRRSDHARTPQGKRYLPYAFLFLICNLAHHSSVHAQQVENALPTQLQPSFSIDARENYPNIFDSSRSRNQYYEKILQGILRAQTQERKLSIGIEHQPVWTPPSTNSGVLEIPPHSNSDESSPPSSPILDPETLTQHIPSAEEQHQIEISSYAGFRMTNPPTLPNSPEFDHDTVYMQKFLPDQYLHEIEENPITFLNNLNSLPETEKSTTSALLARGIMSISGLAGQRNIEMGFQLVERAANNEGAAPALDLLGDLYFHGIGTEPNAEIALRMYKQISPLPAYVAEKIGVLYESGIGVDADLDTAMRYYQLGYSSGSTTAAVKLGDIYRKQSPTSVELGIAHDLYEEASSQGNILGTVRIADMHLAGQVSDASVQTSLALYLRVSNTEGIVHPYSLSARNEARTKAGMLLMSGGDVERNPNLAFQLWESAGKEGYAPATRSIGLALRDGNGIDQNSYEAVRVLRMAADQGSPLASVEADSIVADLCNQSQFASCVAIPVFYATTRMVTTNQTSTVSFGVTPDPDGTMHFGVSWWPIPNDRERQNLNWFDFNALGQNLDIWWDQLKSWYLNKARVHNNVHMRPERFSEELRKAAGQKGIMIFVHGYNNTFRDAAQRAAQFAYDTVYTGPTVIYSWPSQGGTEVTGGYTVDERRQYSDCTAFVNFLQRVETALGRGHRIKIVAHSMGSRLVFSALTACVNSGAEIPPEIDIDELPDNPSLDETRGNSLDIVFAAPDIHTENFRKYSVEVELKVNRITIYASTEDKVLQAGKTILHGGEARLGLGGSARTVVAGMHTIDASEVEAASILQHAYVFRQERITHDVGEILRLGRHPDCRTWPVRQDDGRNEFWILDNRIDPPTRSEDCNEEDF